jgi:diacylglycerol kinase (ATP)
MCRLRPLRHRTKEVKDAMLSLGILVANSSLRMPQRRAILISNPKTGRYVARRPAQLEALCDYLRAHGVAVKHVATKGPGDATQIAARAANDGYSEVIVSGGDGTINEALQGMIGTEARLAILPRGTGNVLARELELPLNARGAIEVIARGRARKLHLGCAIDEATGAKRYFFLMAGIGLDAEVVSRVRPGLKKRIGKAAFWYSGLGHLADWEPVPFEIKIADESYSATFATIGKAARYGGDLCVTPRARIDRPEFEICLVDSRSRLRYLALLSQAMRGGMRGDKRGIRFLHATRAQASGNTAVQVDGELIGRLPMTFEIAPHSIEVIVP